MQMLLSRRDGGAQAHHHPWLDQAARPRTVLVLAALALALAAMLFTGSAVNSPPAAKAAVGPVGNGFVVTAGDLTFILKQIRISERHAAAFRGDPLAAPANPNAAGDPNYCQALVGPADDQIPDRLTSYGLRLVDGSCNNLFADRANFAAADVAFPRLTDKFIRNGEPAPPGFPASPTGEGTGFGQKLAGNIVYDSQPRVISNLIVDQTSTNPAAVAAAGNPVRSQGNEGIVPCSVPPVATDPIDCVPPFQTLFIPNVTTDVGLSPPYNSLFTFFGQFFDHGVDQTVKSGGTVIVPLKADDPLIAGPDHIAGNADDLPAQLRFMAITRAQNQPGPDKRPRYGGRHPGRQQHRHAVGRPEPDLHVAPVAPVLPARVHARGRPPAVDGQVPRRPRGRPDLPRLARRPGWHLHLGCRQGTGRWRCSAWR